ncbi:threonine aldolase family protein [Nocardioides nitrophenolicus]|uniref:threonine aldolase family protein n=1 Tax=Nocardioides nitrophenolicus TaxID=60489 RepID=UPI00195F7CBF|nr:beta-eliminating lyase-related protein [Nocardioides nitrophenolicus]MBM7520442.1 threonine aldolase [Nocardioides nitrophenolicus]
MTLDFTSDHAAPAHPAVLAAVAEANRGRTPSYGADPWTREAERRLRQVFGPTASYVPVFNGTGANVLALSAMTRRWESVLCAEDAHVHTDETAAPERAGLKLVLAPSPAGRIRPGGLAPHLAPGNRHRAQVSVLSLTQSTELGTCYDVADLRALCAEAHDLGLAVHLDGARLANAAATLGVSWAELTTAVGVDVVSLGSSKNGGLLGDGLVVLDPGTVPGIEFLQKAVGQLPAKTRFVSAQLLALLEDDLWHRNAEHANRQASRLAAGLGALPDVGLPVPTEANAVFVDLAAPVADRLTQDVALTTWRASGERRLLRLMTAWDTDPADVDRVVALVAAALGAGRPKRADQVCSSPTAPAVPRP